MDPSVQLALMTKAKLVFESENTFLSFPALSPLSYPPDRLKFGTANEITPQELLDLSEFARITNQIPAGSWRQWRRGNTSGISTRRCCKLPSSLQVQHVTGREGPV